MDITQQNVDEDTHIAGNVELAKDVYDLQHLEEIERKAARPLEEDMESPLREGNLAVMSTKDLMFQYGTDGMPKPGYGDNDVIVQMVKNGPPTVMSQENYAAKVAEQVKKRVS